MSSPSRITFTVPGTPISQGSMKSVGKGRMIHKPELIAWRKKVAQVALIHARQAGWELPLDRPVLVKAHFYLTKPQRPRFHDAATRPDLDKLIRAIGDALSPNNGAKLLAEDSRIIGWQGLKYYATPGKEHAEITITLARLHKQPDETDE